MIQSRDQQESGEPGESPTRLPAQPPPTDSPRHPPSFGRDDELRRAEAVALEAEAGGGRTLLISGAPGIGKTHLALAIGERLARRGWQVLRGSALLHEHHRAYGPLIEALSAFLRNRHHRQSGPRSPRLPLDALAAQTLARLLGPALPADYRPDQAAPIAGERMLHQGLLRVFAAIAAAQGNAERSGAPILLILDDLQWADNATRSLIGFLLRTLPETSLPMMLALCFQPEGPPPDGPPADGLVPESVEGSALSLALGRLDPDAAADLLRSVVGGLILPPQAAEAIVRRAAGNPLLLNELARAWVLGDTPRAGGDARQPETIGDAIRLRLGRLTPAARAIAEVGAIAQGLFTPTLVGAVRRLAPGLVDQAVDELLGAQIVRWHGDGTLRFEHALIGEALAAAIPAPIRARLHSAIGRGAQDPLPPPDALLRHLAAGRGTPEDDRALIAAGLAAGKAAQALWALDDARSAYDQTIAALRRIGGPPEHWIEAWLELARVEGKQGRFAAAEGDAFPHAGQASAACPSARRLAGLAWIACKQSEYPAAIARFEAAIGLAPTGDPAARLGLALVLRLSGETARSQALLAECLSGPADAPANAQGTPEALAAIVAEHGGFAEARGFFADAIALALRSGPPFGTIAAHLAEWRRIEGSPPRIETESDRTEGAA